MSALSFRIVLIAAVCIAAIQPLNAAVIVPDAANLGTVAPITGAYGHFWDSPGDLASIRTLVATHAIPDRSWTPSTVSYSGADPFGLFALITPDTATISPHTDVADISNSRFALRCYLHITPGLDLDPNTPGINVNANVYTDDIGEMVIGGGPDADGTTGAAGVNLPRTSGSDIYRLVFPSEGYYQLDEIWQENGGGTEFSVNLPGSALSFPVPEPGMLSLLGLDGCLIARRRQR